ncbi:MAG: P1 family peptidase [Deltaproteobacteria bacterium]|nr:P1 family peptidase [Deltaproteobacteria bacterium]
MESIAISDIEGLSLGHWQDQERHTGCTAILAPKGAVASGFFPGFAPALHETGVLSPTNPCPRLHALILSGGSAFGLAAASGAARLLKEKEIGLDTGPIKVPIVPAAAIYDYPYNLSGGRLPDEESGYEAAKAALAESNSEKIGFKGDRLLSGPFGAGFSARSGKLGEPLSSSPSGLGSYGLKIGELKMAALAVVNPLGSVVDPLTGRLISGFRAKDGSLADREEILLRLRARFKEASGFFRENTVLVAVATNAKLSKVDAYRLAVMASGGIARSVYPSNTLYDGDAVFALSTCDFSEEEDVSWLGGLAAEVVARAILESALAAAPKTEVELK